MCVYVLCPAAAAAAGRGAPPPPLTSAMAEAVLDAADGFAGRSRMAATAAEARAAAVQAGVVEGDAAEAYAAWRAAAAAAGAAEVAWLQAQAEADRLRHEEEAAAA